MWGPAVEAVYLESRRQGCTITAACAAAGIDPSTFRKQRKKDPTLAIRDELAKESSVATVEGAVFKAASEPDHHVRDNVKAQELFLYNRASDRYRKEQHVTQTVRGNVLIEAKPLSPTLSVGEVQKLRGMAHQAILGSGEVVEAQVVGDDDPIPY